jgi:hypothetical protein
VSLCEIAVLFSFRFRSIPMSWFSGVQRRVPLDVRLGSRMLVKYPGLTLVGGLAMAFAVWAGATTFELVGLFVNPSLPLPGGERIVQIRNWNVAEGGTDPRALRDFAVWREQLRSVTDIGAYRDLSRNLAAPGGASPVQVAEITASGFRIAPDRPLLGRVLGPADERAGAPPVVVLGYDVWRTRFAGDRGVLGRSVKLGDSFATVVGVMPEGYAFPVSHDAWTPLQSDVLDQPPAQGPGVTVFGRLAPGVSYEQAQVELSVLGRRAAAQHPDTHEHLRPQVVAYTRSFVDPSPSDTPFLYAVTCSRCCSWCSSAATSRCSSSRARRRARGSWLCAAPSARRAGGSWRSSSPRRSCSAGWRRWSGWPRRT